MTPIHRSTGVGLCKCCPRRRRAHERCVLVSPGCRKLPKTYTAGLLHHPRRQPGIPCSYRERGLSLFLLRDFDQVIQLVQL